MCDRTAVAEFLRVTLMSASRRVLMVSSFVLVVLIVAYPLRVSAAAPPLSQTNSKGAFKAKAVTQSPSPHSAQTPPPKSAPTQAPSPTQTPNNPAPAVNAQPNPAPCGLNGAYFLVPSGSTGNAIQPNTSPNACPPGPPPPLTPATSPPPNLNQYYAQIFEEITTSPGNIAAAPPNHTGLVNLASCFWLTGQAVPKQKQVTMTLKGAPNSAGQQIAYQVTLTVTLQNVTWNFGDGSSAGTPPPTQCVGISGDPPSLVAHDYVSYSDSDFMVTASETYGGSVSMTWTDDNGSESETLTGPAQTIATDPYPVKVDQEEGLGTG